MKRLIPGFILLAMMAVAYVGPLIKMPHRQPKAPDHYQHYCLLSLHKAK